MGDRGIVARTLQRERAAEPFCPREMQRLFGSHSATVVIVCLVYAIMAHDDSPLIDEDLFQHMSIDDMQNQAQLFAVSHQEVKLKRKAMWHKANALQHLLSTKIKQKKLAKPVKKVAKKEPAKAKHASSTHKEVKQKRKKEWAKAKALQNFLNTKIKQKKNAKPKPAAHAVKKVAKKPSLTKNKKKLKKKKKKKKKKKARKKPKKKGVKKTLSKGVKKTLSKVKSRASKGARKRLQAQRKRFESSLKSTKKAQQKKR